MEPVAEGFLRVAETIDMLLCRVRDQRDRAAFVELFRVQGPKIKAYLIRGGLSGALAEETTQEVFLKVWRRSSSFDANRGSASAWIYTIARNARVDRQREQRVPRWDLDDPTLVTRPPSPLEATAVARSNARLHDAMNGLPTDQRLVVHAAYFEHRTMREIADAEAVPIGTVKSRMRLALSRLRALLGQEESS